jgi:hypothetical protein
VARIEPTGQESLETLRDSLFFQAVQLGHRVSAWEHEGALYMRSGGYAEKSFDVVRNARSNEFRDFLALVVAEGRRTFLSKLASYFFLDGKMPRTLKVLRFERLGDDVREALQTVGIDHDAEFPWLNRSNHGEYMSYYDDKSERLVYEESRWLFDRGYYERLDLAAVETASSAVS